MCFDKCLCKILTTVAAKRKTIVSSAIFRNDTMAEIDLELKIEEIQLLYKVTINLPRPTRHLLFVKFILAIKLTPLSTMLRQTIPSETSAGFFLLQFSKHVRSLALISFVVLIDDDK